MAKDDRKLTSVKVPPELFDKFKIECVKRKFSLQKLVERSMDLFLEDETFKKQIVNHNKLLK